MRSYRFSQVTLHGNITFSEKNPDLTVHGALDTINLPAEAFRIETEAQYVKVTGGDPTGLMYGLLDLKEQLEQGNQAIEERNEQPFLSFRAIKHNLPWDSYRNSEALSLHYETCRDTSYWESFLDMMAENRFNQLTLWNLHPFNYMVKTKKYPEACGFSDEEMAQWEKLWHTLFRMARERGIETYIPAKDYITALPGASYSYAFERQWMFYKVMGRLFYNPKTPDDVFIDAFEHRFPGQGEQLFSAQAKVSRVPLMIASIYNGTADLSMYSEGFLCIVFIDGKRFVRLMPLTALANRQPLDPNYLSVSEWLDTDPVVPEGKRSPIQLADSLDAFCSKALREVADIEAGENVDLIYEVSDIRTWANLGMYFSNKLRAAVAYKKFTRSGEKADLEQSVDWLEKAIEYWHELVEITEPIYDPVPLVDLTRNENEDDYFHWSIIEKQVLEELEWLKSQ